MSVDLKLELAWKVLKSEHEYFFKTVFLAQQIFIKQVIACFFIKKIKFQKNIFVFNNRSNDDMTATSSRMSEVVHGQIKKKLRTFFVE